MGAGGELEAPNLALLPSTLLLLGSAPAARIYCAIHKVNELQGAQGSGLSTRGDGGREEKEAGLGGCWGWRLLYLSVLGAAGEVGHEAAHVLHCPFADVFQRGAFLAIQKQTSHGACSVRRRGGGGKKGGKEGRRKKHKSLKSHTDNKQPAI